MFAALIEGLLPGLRSLRPPVFAGIGWTLLLWLVLAEIIPPPAEAEGWISQVYAIGTFIGPVGISVVALLTIFIVGAIAQAITEPVARAVGRASRGVLGWFSRGSAAIDEAEHDALTQVRRDQLRSALSQSNAAGPMYTFDPAVFEAVQFTYGRDELFQRLHSELAKDPLDALRPADKETFDELQRERSERAVRLAISFPLLAIGILSWLASGIWPGAAISALGLVMMFRYSANLDEERHRTLKLLMLRGGSSPALNAARNYSNFDLVEYTGLQSELAKREKPS